MAFHLIDMGAGYLIYALIFYGLTVLAAGIGVLLVITVVEGAILRLINWGDLWQSMRDSLSINFITTAVGLCLAISTFDTPDSILGLPGTLGEIFPQILLLWSVTFLIEGFLLGVFRRKSPKETWSAAFTVNTCSYTLLVVIMSLVNVTGYL